MLSRISLIVQTLYVFRVRDPKFRRLPHDPRFFVLDGAVLAGGSL
jgi:hypothetical protein